MKFKIGDKVRVIADEEALKRDSIYDLSLTGREGEVIDIVGDDLPYEVKFSRGRYWWLNAEDLELVDENKKESNPKDALAFKKVPLSVLPNGPLYGAALAFLEGGRKYGRHNYRVVGVKASVYNDAAKGHIDAWFEGEDIDPESGLHHLDKAIASLIVIRDGILMENWVDDRPPKYPGDISKKLRKNPMVAEILERYPDCVPPYTQKGVETKPGYGGNVRCD